MNRMKEADVQDAQGNIVIASDLKVRHKDSQYEYTVDSVVPDESGKNVVLLRLPEEPRFESEPASDALTSDLKDKNVIYETDPTIMIYEPESDSGDNEEINSDQDFLAVPQDEFEKDYEVR